MEGMFVCSQYNHPLDSWDVSQVESMDRMFSESEYNHPLGSWDTSKVLNMIDMFLILNIIIR